MTELWTQLKQRKLVQWALAYVAAAFALLQGVDIVAHQFDWSEDVQRGITLALVVGFFITLVLAWYHGEQGRQRVTGPELLLIALALAIGGGFLWQFSRVPLAGKKASVQQTSGAAENASKPIASTPESNAATPAKSIAVLPFANLSGDQSQQYFSDGISEDLLNLLARIPQLQVTARTSSFWFRGKGYTIPQIAEKLHVAYILEGSVQKAGDEVRISVQLVDAASDSQRWSQTYDRRLKDVFKIQDEIGADVVKQLRLQLLAGEPTVKAVDPQAYTFYLQGRLLSYQGTVKALDKSDALYQRALAIEPRYAAAWIGLAQNAINKPWLGNCASQEGFGQAQRYTRKALALEPDNAVGLSFEGYLATFEKFDFNAAAANFKRALALDPENPDVLLNVGKFLFVLDRPEQAMAVLHRAKRLDPLNSDIDVNMAEVSIQQGRLKQALKIARKAHKLSPENIQIQFLTSWVEIGIGQPGKALADYPNSKYPLVSALCGTGRRAEGIKILNDYLDQAGHYPTPAVASVYADCGDVDKAFALLDKTVGQRNRSVPYTIYGVSFSKLHDDPRWKAYLRKVGFAPDQLARVKFDVKLPALPTEPGANAAAESP
ncbi:MAG: tetratricopeptide repeat protein [Rhodanobacteraceae bacterium]